MSHFNFILVPKFSKMVLMDVFLLVIHLIEFIRPKLRKKLSQTKEQLRTHKEESFYDNIFTI